MKLNLHIVIFTFAFALTGCGDKKNSETNNSIPNGNKESAGELGPGQSKIIDPFDFEDTKKKAEAGDANAQDALGDMYRKGKLVQRDYGKALEWYKVAAEQGNPNAQYAMGAMYSGGMGVSKDKVRAVEWWKKAAANPFASDAHYALGWAYETGEGVPKDIVKAVEWYQKAATVGMARAQLHLGWMYSTGDGVVKNAVQAVEWFRQAAEQGGAHAQYNLGEMYSKGEGVPRDYAKAFDWKFKAAAQGLSSAQNDVGRMYAVGEGVSKNLVRAYAWFNLAAAQDNKAAKENRERIERILLPSQRDEGQKLASSWKLGDTMVVSEGSAPSSTSDAASAGAISKQSTGTAFAVSAQGHALTNHHVINGCSEIRVSGREGLAKFITSDSVNDLALLQLPGKTSDVAYLNSDPGKLRQGEDIIVFGYPLNSVLSSGGNLTPGTVSALTGLGNNTNQIQITAPIQSGSSGSPVMDKKGNVMGVVSMKLDDGKMVKATGQVGQNVNFAVNGQTVKAFLDTNNVKYKTGGGLFSFEKNNADIAQEARKWTVLVECWK